MHTFCITISFPLVKKNVFNAEKRRKGIERERVGEEENKELEEKEKEQQKKQKGTKLMWETLPVQEETF